MESTRRLQLKQMRVHTPMARCSCLSLLFPLCVSPPVCLSVCDSCFPSLSRVDRPPKQCSAVQGSATADWLRHCEQTTVAHRDANNNQPNPTTSDNATLAYYQTVSTMHTETVVVVFLLLGRFFFDFECASRPQRAALREWSTVRRHTTNNKRIYIHIQQEASERVSFSITVNTNSGAGVLFYFAFVPTCSHFTYSIPPLLSCRLVRRRVAAASRLRRR